MKTCTKKIVSLLLSILLIFSSSICAFADREDEKPFLSLGAEQTKAEREKVLEILKISEKDLSEYNVLYVTNQDEHDYLGAYMSDALIGTRALSSVLVINQPKGTGISVTCTNINYCTPGMYRNALITAGVTDAEVQVVAPKPLPGTAALVGAMKSYEKMTGEMLSEDSKDAATDELITTGEIANHIGDQEKAEELIGLIKQEIVKNNISDKEDIKDVIDKAADSLEINLSEKDRQLIRDLMEKISKLDLDLNSLKSQAKDFYDKISNIKIDRGVWESIVQWFRNIWHAITEFFSNLFNANNEEIVTTTLSESITENQNSTIDSTNEITIVNKTVIETTQEKAEISEPVISDATETATKIEQ